MARFKPGSLFRAVLGGASFSGLQPAFDAIVAAGGAALSTLSSTISSLASMGGSTAWPASAANIRAGTAGFYLVTAERLAEAQGAVTLTPSGGNLTVDGATFRLGVVPAAATAVAVNNIANLEPAGRVRVQVPASGGSRNVTAPAATGGTLGFPVGGVVIPSGETGLFDFFLNAAGDPVCHFVPSTPRQYSAAEEVVLRIPVFGAGVTATTGDGKRVFGLPAQCAGKVLAFVEGYVLGTAGATSGAMTFQVANVTDGVDVLSTNLSFATAAVYATTTSINAANDDAAAGDRWRIDCDAVHGTPAVGPVDLMLHFR